MVDPKVVDGAGGGKVARSESPLQELTPRERDVLREMAEGKNNAAIAESLFLTERSVEKVIHSIFLKLGLGLGSVGAQAGEGGAPLPRRRRANATRRLRHGQEIEEIVPERRLPWADSDGARQPPADRAETVADREQLPCSAHGSYAALDDHVDDEERAVLGVVGRSLVLAASDARLRPPAPRGSRSTQLPRSPSGTAAAG